MFRNPIPDTSELISKKDRGTISSQTRFPRYEFTSRKYNWNESIHYIVGTKCNEMHFSHSRIMNFPFCKNIAFTISKEQYNIIPHFVYLFCVCQTAILNIVVYFWTFNLPFMASLKNFRPSVGSYQFFIIMDWWYIFTDTHKLNPNTSNTGFSPYVSAS